MNYFKEILSLSASCSQEAKTAILNENLFIFISWSCKSSLLEVLLNLLGVASQANKRPRYTSDKDVIPPFLWLQQRFSFQEFLATYVLAPARFKENEGLKIYFPPSFLSFALVTLVWKEAHVYR